MIELGARDFRSAPTSALNRGGSQNTEQPGRKQSQSVVHSPMKMGLANVEAGLTFMPETGAAKG